MHAQPVVYSKMSPDIETSYLISSEGKGTEQAS